LSYGLISDAVVIVFILLIVLFCMYVYVYGSVKKKGSMLTGGKPAMLPSQTPENQSIVLPKLLAIEGFQEEREENETISEDDDDDSDQSEDVVYVESKPDGNATSKKRKASKKLKSPRFVSSHFLTVGACKFPKLLSCMSFIFYRSSFIEIITFVTMLL